MAERFQLGDMIGQGGMGVVWKARDRETGRVVAIKVPHAHLATDPDFLRRFQHEVEAAQRIDSPFVVKTFGHGRRAGLPFMVMEFVEGASLKQRVQSEGPLSWGQAKGLLRQVALGLDAAHRAGVLHRDVKPSNILVDSGGRAKLIDLGVARAADQSQLTGSKTNIGTPAYMAPDGEASPQSDLYSLGCVAFEMLAGRPPFAGQGQSEVVIKHVREEPKLELLPPEARPVVGWLLRKRPADRPRSAGQLAAVLEGTSTVPRSPARTTPWRQRPVAVGFAGVAAAAVLALGAIVPFLAFNGGGGDGNSGAVPGLTPSPSGSDPPATVTPPTPGESPTATATSTSVTDRDGDGRPDGQDNCPGIDNRDQADRDGDATGDACDSDIDGDGVPNSADLCDSEAARTPNGCPLKDRDNDGIEDSADNCVSTPNRDQADRDNDGIGDACDGTDSSDSDGDGVLDTIDNCKSTRNISQDDFDRDGEGDACDADIDGDGVPNSTDQCDTEPASTANGCPEPDRDNDGVPDVRDNCVAIANPAQQDIDGDGSGDACDTFDNRDPDGDGVPNGTDQCDTVPAATPNGCPPPDGDGDGIPDGPDNCDSVYNPGQGDLDGDGAGDACDSDRDGDGVPNSGDGCPDTWAGTSSGCPAIDYRLDVTIDRTEFEPGDPAWWCFSLTPGTPFEFLFYKSVNGAPRELVVYYTDDGRGRCFETVMGDPGFREYTFEAWVDGELVDTRILHAQVGATGTTTVTWVQ